MHKKLSILYVNTLDVGGGAEKVALNMFQYFRKLGYIVKFVVGYKKKFDDSDILVLPHYKVHKGWSWLWWRIFFYLQASDDKTRGVWRLRQIISKLANPRMLIDKYRGIENFRFPGANYLLRLTPHSPDIIHCHNLHGEYFDLRILPWLSQQIPVVLTLHDTWLLTGHCSHSFDCERWKTGCGYCPDLTIPPAILRDATAYNWRRKRDIFTQSRLYVATPSHWLMRQVAQSMLGSAVLDARVIPNGVDISVFQSKGRQVARESLDIPANVKLLLFTANGIQRNVWKDYQTMRTAIIKVSEHLDGQSIIFIALGESAPPEQIGQAEIHFVPYQKEPTAVARYYQAADIYLHAAKAEVWGLTITEALACGTPVVATAVGGIPEQIKSLKIGGESSNGYSQDEATGILVPPGDVDEMAKAIELLLNNDDLRYQLGENAAKDACQRFSLDQQVDTYLNWYQEIVKQE